MQVSTVFLHTYPQNLRLLRVLKAISQFPDALVLQQGASMFCHYSLQHESRLSM